VQAEEGGGKVRRGEAQGANALLAALAIAGALLLPLPVWAQNSAEAQSPASDSTDTSEQAAANDRAAASSTTSEDGDQSG